jgi:DNA-binding response OmpR family regulator
MDNIRVLIVDDEEELAKTIAERLEIRGIRCQTVLDSDKAIDSIKSQAPDVVVLDLMMPGIGGIGILKQIKSMELNIPVILLTGYGSKDMTIEGMNLGAFDYVLKPCNLDDLITKIQEAKKGK